VEGINKFVNADVIVIDELKERCVGVFEGLTNDEIAVKYPDLWNKKITRIYNDAPPGGETIKEVELRVSKGIQKIKNQYSDKNILIVAHAFVGRVIYKIVCGNNCKDVFDTPRLENAQFLELS